MYASTPPPSLLVKERHRLFHLWIALHAFKRSLWLVLHFVKSDVRHGEKLLGGKEKKFLTLTAAVKTIHSWLEDERNTNVRPSVWPSHACEQVHKPKQDVSKPPTCLSPESVCVQWETLKCRGINLPNPEPLTFPSPRDTAKYLNYAT